MSSRRAMKMIQIVTASRWIVAFALLMQTLPFTEGQRSLKDPASVDQDKRAEATVQKLVQPFLENGCHVGLSIAVVQKSGTRFYNFGWTSRVARIPPGPDSVYEIASVTKTFTSVLATEALLQRRIQLDTDFRQYLPEQYPNLEWQGHPITLRSLATHTSGLPRDLPDTDDLYAHRDPQTMPFNLIARDSGYDRTRYLAALHKVVLRSNPGAEENYSNLGFKVIGWGLETVYGSPFERLLQRHILQPLKMQSTGFVLNASERSRLVKGYSAAGGLMPYHLRNAGAAYGLYSTPRDMARYVEWQLDETDPAVMLSHKLIQGDDRSGRTIVWNLSTLNGSRMLWHGGGTFGMSSQVVLFPAHREGYALLANDTCNGTESALKDMAIALHEGLR